MAKTTSNEELAERIEQLVREHIAVSRRAARDAVERAFTSGAPAPARARATQPDESVGRGKRRTPQEMAALRERLYQAVCAKPGETISVLMLDLDSSATELSRPMTELKRSGRVRSVGARNHMRYFPMANDAASA